jgi:hypothetical protein
MTLLWLRRALDTFDERPITSKGLETQLVEDGIDNRKN